MNRRRFLALTAAGAGVFAGCSASPWNSDAETQTDGTGRETPSTAPDGATRTPTPVPPLDGSWRSYQHDAGNTGAADGPGPVDDPVERWHRPVTAARPGTSPVASDGVFVVVSTTGVVYARAAADGSVRWIGSRTADTNVSPVADGGTVVVTEGETLVGIDVETGAEQWTAPLDAPVLGLAAVGGRVVAATSQGLSAVSTADGSRQWDHGTEETVVTPPGTGDGTVVVGLASGDVLARDVETGTHRWRTSPGTESTFAPAVGTAGVYVPGRSRLVALDTASGTRQWTHRTSEPVAASPVATPDALYLVTVDDDAEAEPSDSSPEDGTATPTPTDVRWFEGTVSARSPDDGEELWAASRTERYSFTSGPPAELPLTVADGFVLVAFTGTLVGYDAASGEEAWSATADAVKPAVTRRVVSTGAVGIELADGSRRWRFRTGEAITAGPVVLGNALYVGSEDNYLYAMTGNAGRIEWTARTDDAIRATPAVDDDAVYVGTGNGTLYAFDRGDGSELWATAVGGQIRSPAVLDGTIYLGNFSETVRAIDAADGAELWRTRVDSEHFVALEVAVADGAVFAGTNGDLRAFEAEDGTERWRLLVSERPVVQSPPVAADGRVFVNMGDRLRAVDTADGSEVWSAPIAGNANDPPVVRDGVVYTSSDEAVHAVDATDGTGRWQTSIVGGSLTMAATDGALYGWGHDTPLLALDPADGSVLWRDRSFDPSSPLAVTGDYLFVGDRSGSVRALGPDPGSAR